MAYNYKNDFPIFQHTDVAYIDNAATAQRPQCVLDAVADFYRCHNANPLRGLYPLSVEATDIYEQARETVRSFIGEHALRAVIALIVICNGGFLNTHGSPSPFLRDCL